MYFDGFTIFQFYSLFLSIEMKVSTVTAASKGCARFQGGFEAPMNLQKW